MRDKTYDKVRKISEKNRGYVSTGELLTGGLTNRQIASLVEEEILQKVAYGYYWLKENSGEKPADYKMLEVCLCNPKAVICTESACYYHGLIETEPSVMSVATARNDRSKMDMCFPIVRHYYSEKRFMEGRQRIVTEYGFYNIYDMEKSICDCVFFKDCISTEIYEMIIENYRKKQQKQTERMMAYAKALNIQNRIKGIID